MDEARIRRKEWDARVVTKRDRDTWDINISKNIQKKRHTIQEARNIAQGRKLSKDGVN